MDEEKKPDFRCTATGCYSKVKEFIILSDVGVQIYQSGRAQPGRISFVSCVFPVCHACGKLVEQELTNKKRKYLVKELNDFISSERFVALPKKTYTEEKEIEKNGSFE